MVRAFVLPERVNNPMEIVPNNSASPFDAIKQTRPDGSEFWSARDLMGVLGYDSWRRFDDSISRARAALEAQGTPSQPHIAGGGKKVEVGLGITRNVIDYSLSRYGAYMVAMNGDPRKPEIAAAQSYFAIQTRIAETAPAKELTGAELMAKALLEAQNVLAAKDERIAQLEPKAKIADEVMTPDERLWGFREMVRVIIGNYNVTEEQIKEILRTKKIIEANSVKPRNDAVRTGYAKPVPFKNKLNGYEGTQTKFTQKTFEYVYSQLQPTLEIEAA